MKHYVVTWTIDIFTADNPTEAALHALMIQRDNESIATVFDVLDKDTGEVVQNLDVEDQLVAKSRVPQG